MISYLGNSVTARLTLLFATVSVLVLLVLGFVVGRLVDRHFGELDSELLSNRLELVRHALSETDPEDHNEKLIDHLNELFAVDKKIAVRITNEKGDVLYSRAFELEYPKPSLIKTPVRIESANGEALWVVSDFVRFANQNVEPAFVELVSDLSHHERFMSTFKMALWTTVVIAAAISGLMGFMAVRSGLKPLRNISHKAARITASHLDQRLPVETVPNELAEVARTLNEMLARLEGSFLKLSDFSSDLAHELRTPVSNLLTQTQVTLSKDRDISEYQEVMLSNSEELERLSRTIADMLFLAKADNELIIPNFEVVNLRGEVDSLLEFYEVLAEERSIDITVQGNGRVSGDRLMLRRAVGNLISNAVRHSNDGSAVDIEISSSHQGSTVLTVGNHGETIGNEHLARLFDRFYRADPSRKRDSALSGPWAALNAT